MGDMLPFVNVGTGLKVADVSGEVSNTCVVLDGGDVKCWGLNNTHIISPFVPGMPVVGSEPGTMGDNLPSLDLGDEKAIKVAVGFDHACIVLEGGSARCWGGNSRGIMGSDVPWPWEGGPLKDVPNLDFGAGEQVKQLATSYTHACVLLVSGRVKCWGDNGAGGLGYGDMEDRGDALPFVELF